MGDTQQKIMDPSKLTVPSGLEEKKWGGERKEQKRRQN